MENLNKKTNKLVILGIGVFSVFICFFLDTASFRYGDSSGYMNCAFTFTGKCFCVYQGSKIELVLGDCQGDRFCDIIKAAPVYGGLSLSLGVIAIIGYQFKEQIAKKISQNNAKWAVLIVLGGAVVFQLLIPVFYIDDRWYEVTLSAFPLILEFLTLIMYCSGWGLILQEKQDFGNKDSLLA